MTSSFKVASWFAYALMLSSCGKETSEALVSSEALKVAHLPSLRCISRPRPTDGGATEIRYMAQVGHGSGVDALAVSDDRRHIFSGSTWDGTAASWDVNTGRMLAKVKVAAEEPALERIPIGLSANGWAVVRYDASKIRIWDLLTARPRQDIDINRAAPGGCGEIGNIQAFAFSENASHLLAVGQSRAAVWRLPSGECLASTVIPQGKRATVALSSDGSLAVFGDDEREVLSWSVDSNTLSRITTLFPSVPLALVTADAKYIVAASHDPSTNAGAVELFEIGTKAAHRSIATDKPITAGVITHSGREFMAPLGDTRPKGSSEPGKLFMWRMFQDEPPVQIAGNSTPLAVAISKDEFLHVWGATDGVGVYPMDKAIVPTELLRKIEDVRLLAASDDGRRLLVATRRGLNLWDLAEAKPKFTRSFNFDGMTSGVGAERLLQNIWDHGKPSSTSIALSRDGRMAAVGFFNGDIAVLDEQGDLIQWWGEGKGIAIRSLAFSPDGRSLLAVAGTQHAAALLSLASGKIVKSFEEDSESLCPHTSASFSPLGDEVLLAQGCAATSYDTRSGAVIHRFTPDGSPMVWAATYTPDGQHALTADADGFVDIWSAKTGANLRRLDGKPGPVRGIAVTSGDHGLVAAGTKIWRFDSGALLHDLSGSGVVFRRHVFGAATTPMAMPAAGGYLALATDEGVGFFDVTSGRGIASMTMFGGEWAVFDPAGRYETSANTEDIPIHAVVMGMPTNVESLKLRARDHRLLAKALGFDAEPLKELVLDGLAPPPELVVTSQEGTEVSLHIEAIDRGGGIGRIVVRLNGDDLPPIEPTVEEGKEPCRTYDVQLARVSGYRRDATNIIEVRAFDASNRFASVTLEAGHGEKAQNGALTRPKLWAVVIGINDYQGSELDLKYAASDAEAFGTSLKVAAEGLFEADNVDVTTIAARGGKSATKAQIESAFRHLRNAAPGDVVVVYLAGHGVSPPSDGEPAFYYPTSNAASVDELADETMRDANSISSDELKLWLLDIPAARRVVILDTCYAGAAVPDLSEARSFPTSRERALQRFAKGMGVWILAGAAADKPSYEATRFGQGLLTYSLLAGMAGPALRDGEFVDVGALFRYAEEMVPKLAEGLRGIQRPEIRAPQESIDIGKLSPDSRRSLPLGKEKPMLVRSSLQDETMLDPRGIASWIDHIVRDSERLVFLDTHERPDAYIIAGRYEDRSGKVSVTAQVSFRGKAISVRQIERTSGEMESLAREIVLWAEREVLAHWVTSQDSSK